MGRRNTGSPSGGQAPFVRRMILERARVPSFDVYPFCLPAVRTLHALDLHPAVTFLIGDNGSGKSTLLEALAVACGFNPEGGSKGFRFATRESHSTLHQYLQLERGGVPRTGFFFRAESVFNLATEIEAMDDVERREGFVFSKWGKPPPKVVEAYGGTSLHDQSHGESFFALFLHRMRSRGLYLLDEPEAALSPTRQMAMLALMQQLVRNGSQLVVASHSPILLAYPQARILELSAEGMHERAYEECEPVVVTRRFLNDPTGMLRVLLADEGSHE